MKYLPFSLLGIVVSFTGIYTSILTGSSVTLTTATDSDFVVARRFLRPLSAVVGRKPSHTARIS